MKRRANANSSGPAWALHCAHLPFKPQWENRSRQQNRRGKRLVHIPLTTFATQLSRSAQSPRLAFLRRVICSLTRVVY